MALEFEEFSVPLEEGEAHVLMVTPVEHVVATRSRLAEDVSLFTELDRQILDRIQARAGAVTGFIFRGTHPNGVGRWVFADDLDNEERRHLTMQMFRGHIRLNRHMVRFGVTAHMYIEWERKELEAFSAATENLSLSLQSMGPLRPSPDTHEAALRRLDLWICANFTFYAELPLAVAVRSILPMRLQRMRAQRERLRAMCEQVDPAVFVIGE